MKICLINNLYKPYSRGGAEIVSSIIAEGLRESGHSVFVITTEPRKINGVRRENNVYRFKSLYFDLGKYSIAFRFIWHLYDIFDIVTAYKVYKILKQEMPDAVITNNLTGLSFLIPFAIHKLHLRQIHVLHDIQLLHPSGLMIYKKENALNSLPARLYQILCRRSFVFAEIVISPSQWLMDLHRQYGFFIHCQNIVLNNPMDKANIESVRQGSNASKNFLFVGQLEYHKGIILLLDAFKSCQKSLNDDFNLVIAGDGSLFESIREEDKHNNIIIKGRVEHDEVLKLMKESFVLIIPSLCYENSPTVAYEALQVGLPILAANLGGLGELIKKTAGVLFEPADIGDLKEKMIMAASDRIAMEKCALAGRKQIADFDRVKYLERIISLIEKK